MSVKKGAASARSSYTCTVVKKHKQPAFCAKYFIFSHILLYFVVAKVHVSRTSRGKTAAKEGGEVKKNNRNFYKAHSF